MKDPICQSCGMKMIQKEDFGTNQDATFNEEYCCYCFQNGNFVHPFTMQEMIEHNLNFLEEFNKDSPVQLNKEQARKEMLAYFPTLKRWKK